MSWKFAKAKNQFASAGMPSKRLSVSRFMPHQHQLQQHRRQLLWQQPARQCQLRHSLTVI